MKRPLFAVCLAIAGVIALWHLLHPPDLPCKAPLQEEIILYGRVERKENRISYGKEQLILYLCNYSVISKDSNVSGAAIRSGQTKSEKKNENKIVCYTTSPEWEPKMGSVVLVRGKPEDFDKATNPGEFDSRLYYATMGIDFCVKKSEVLWEGENYNVFKESLWRLRCHWQQRLDKVLGSDGASVLKTMLLGDKQALDGQLKNLYQDGGIAHILAISGLHISIIGMGMYGLLRKIRCPILFSALFCAGFVFAYGILTGSGVSAGRAVGMFLLRMLAELTGRGYDMVTAIGVLLLCMILQQPLYVFHSGFLLSFSAVLGICLLRPGPVNKKKRYLSHFEKKAMGIIKIAKENFWGSLSVSLATLPITIGFFYEMPVYGILLNLLVLPLVPVVMYMGLSVLLLPEGMWLGIPAFLIETILTLLETLCEYSLCFPGSTFIRGKPKVWQISVYVALLVLFVLTKKAVKWSKWRRLLPVMAVLLLVLKMPDGARVTFLDVGQGDSICIQTFDQSTYLIDCGSSSEGNVGKYVVAPFLKSEGISYLEAVVITHPDADHCNGLEGLLAEGYGNRIGRLLLPDISEEQKNEAYLELEQLAARFRIPVGYLSGGMQWEDGGLIFTCLHPGKEENEMAGGYIDSNEYSVVLHVGNKDFSVLLAGDVEGTGEERLAETLVAEGIEEVTVLKVAHHGSRYSTTEEFLESVDAKLAVISCGEANAYGHPHRETLLRLKQDGATILTTPKCGAIEIECAKRCGVEIRCSKIKD